MKESRRKIHLMGTVIQLWVQHPDAATLLAEAEAMLRSYQQRFSANDANSQLMAINRQAGLAPVAADPDLFELIKIGKQQSLAKDSFLNIAIGPLVQAWHIGFKDAKYPEPSEITACLKVTDPQKILLEETAKTVFLKERGMAIDLGALAKGWFADAIIAFWQQAGAAGYIDLGGNVLTCGAAPEQADGLWRIGIQNPFLPRGHHAAVLRLKNQSVVTSGIYERTFEWQGQRYHHIFDRQTGYPLQTDLASLTIVSQESLAGEIWTTRLFGRSAVEVIGAVEQLPEIEAIVVTTDGRLAYTQGLAGKIQFQ